MVFNIMLSNNISVKKRYYVLARKYHPDRHKNQADDLNERFSILSRVYSALSDVETRARYDSTGEVDQLISSKQLIWMRSLKPITDDCIEDAKSKYAGSDHEKQDIAKLINETGSCSIANLLNNIPFMRAEDEPRIIAIVKLLIVEKKVPKCTIRKLRK